MSKETELAWAAGFYDGEGCTTVSYRGISKQTGKPYGGASMVVVQAGDGAVEILNRFRLAVGRGAVKGPFHLGKEHWKTHWRWQCLAYADVVEVIRLLTPYLSAVKSEQARRVLSECGDERPPRGHAPIEYCKKGLHLMSEHGRFRKHGNRMMRECGECAREYNLEYKRTHPRNRRKNQV